MSGLLAVSFVTLGALGSTACGTLLPPADLQPPSLRVADFAIESVSVERVVFTVRIATRNPNAVDIPLSNVRFDASLLGQSIAKGAVAEQRFTLPAGGTREVPVSFTVAAADLRRLLARLAIGPLPEAVWELKGTAQWADSPFPIPFERRGELGSLKWLRELFKG